MLLQTPGMGTGDAGHVQHDTAAENPVSQAAESVPKQYRHPKPIVPARVPSG